MMRILIALVAIISIPILVRYVRLRSDLTDSEHVSPEWLRAKRRADDRGARA